MACVLILVPCDHDRMHVRCHYWIAHEVAEYDPYEGLS